LQTLHQSPRDPAFVQNPFQFYQKLRSTGKIIRWSEYDMAVTSDFETVNNILRDKSFVREPPLGFFAGIPKHLFPFYENESRSMLEREPPYHTRLKSLAFPFFTNRKLKELEHEIKELCQTLLQQIPNSKINLISDFSKQFPVIVIARLLGVPEIMAPQLVNWSGDMVAMYQARRDQGIEKKAVTATTEFSEYIKKLLDEKKKKPKEDLISFLISENKSDNPLSNDELISTIILLLNAGHEATVHTISNGVKTILESEFSLSEIIKKPKQLTEEILRYCTPLHMFTRYCSVDTEINGHHFKAGEKIGLLLAAANRDPAYFTDPEDFNPLIKRRANLSLGAGIHFCLGAHLARLELQIAITTLIDFFPSMRITQKPRYQDNFHFFGLKELTLGTEN